MRVSSIILSLFFLWACSPNYESVPVNMNNLEVSGEFLFSGPNTLQGQPDVSLDDIATQAGVEASDIKHIYVSEVNVDFMTDTLSEAIESVLVQWVSDELELISVATKSPLDATGPVTLEVSSDTDILPYLKDDSRTLVIDVNLSQDMDELKAVASFLLNVEHK